MEVLHGQIRPPDSIVRELQSIDPNLRIRFVDASERWMLFRIDPQTGRWERLRLLEWEDGSFRPLDQRLIKELRYGDTWSRPRGVEDILREIRQEDEKRETGLSNRFHDACRAAADDVAQFGSSEEGGVEKIHSLPAYEDKEKDPVKHRIA